jgi:hypothetical protein
MPQTERRLLARRNTPPEEHEPLAVPPDHPFAKTRITGRVFDIDTGEGIAGAVVRIGPSFGAPKLGPLSGDGTLAYSTLADGSYSMRGVPPGTFDLDVSASGFLPARSSFKKFSAVEDDDGFDVGLLRGGTLEGRVTTADHRPIGGAQVFATANESLTIHRDSTIATTDASGRFLLDPVDVRALHVYAAHPKYGSAVALVGGDGLDRRIEIVLDAGRRVRGCVRDADGPIEHASVAIGLQRLANRLVSLAVDSRFSGVDTDRDGRFEINAADSDPVVLIVRAPGYEQASHVVGEGGRARDEGPAAEIEIVLEPAFAFNGEVLGADARPASNAEVMIAAAARGRRSALSTWTDDQGHFRIDGVPKNGPYAVTIRHFAHPTLSVTEDDVRGERRYRLEPEARIQGNIVDAATGRAITKYQYDVRGPVRRQASAVSISGAFEIDQLTPGVYAMTVEASGYETSSLEGVAVEKGQIVKGLVIRMKPAGAIVGQIRGAAIAGVIIVHAWDQAKQLEAEAVAADDGHFSFNDLPTGTYTLTAFGDGDDHGELRGEVQDVRVESGAVTKDIEIIVAPGPG